MQRTQASRSNVLEPVQLKVIVNPVVVCSLKAQVRQVWLSKSLEQNVVTLSRFSAGIGAFSQEGQKQLILIRFILLFLPCTRYQILESGKPAKRPLRQRPPFWIG